MKEASIPRAVILTAIPIEYLAVRKHLIDIAELVHPKGTVYEQGLFNGIYHDWEICIAEIGPGNHTSAMEAERAINYFNPEVALFVGIAGGIKDVVLGDVVAVEKAYGYEKGKVSPMGFLPRPGVGQSSYVIYERAKAEARKNDWKHRLPPTDQLNRVKVVAKPIAAGEKVIAETRSDVYELIKASYSDAVAVEMEGSGFYEACHANSDLQFLIIRGISDLLNNKSETDSKGYQEIAATNASAFAFEVLSKFKVR